MSSIKKSRRRKGRQRIPYLVTMARFRRSVTKRVESSQFLETFASSFRSLLLHGSSSSMVIRPRGKVVVRSLGPMASPTPLRGLEASLIVVDEVSNPHPRITS